MQSGQRVLVSKHSAFNQIILTEDAYGLRTLSFGEDGVPQSIVKVEDSEYLALPYVTVLPLSLGFIEHANRILIAGLGGGTLPRLFHRMLPAAEVDVVELDREVLEVAKQYCGFQETDRLRVHIDDGRDFIEGCCAIYDLIILDIFGPNSIPGHLVTDGFLRAVKRALRRGGAAAANIWGRNSNRLFEQMLSTYRDVFDDVYILDVPERGSKVFVALPEKRVVNQAVISKRLAELPVTRGIRPSEMKYRHSDTERIRNGQILRD